MPGARQDVLAADKHPVVDHKVARIAESRGDAMTTQEKTTTKNGGDQRDRRLIQWMQSDLKEGFNRVAEVYWKQLNLVAYGVLCGSHLVHLTEDVVQEGLISAYRDLAEHSNEDRSARLSKLQLRAWLYTIVRRKALKCLIMAEQHLELSAGLLGEEIEEQQITTYPRTRYDDPAYLHERKESMREARIETRRLLANLSPTQRAIVVRKYLSEADTDPEKITYRQIAEEMNRPVGTIKSEASRARAQMREQLSAQRTGIDASILAKLG
jgi:RNA polymerase sigma factor (sigma-70 family)